MRTGFLAAGTAAVVIGGFAAYQALSGPAVLTEWHPQLDRATAEADGLEPMDFTWLQYPCSDPTIAAPASVARFPFEYRVTLPADTPQLNRYIEEADRQPGVEYERVAEPGWLKIPDPEGVSALAWVAIELVDVDTGDVLDRNLSPNHVDGAVVGWPGESAELWQVLQPGGAVRVRLQVHGVFFPYIREGGASLHYAATADGYVTTPRVDSSIYVLAMDQDGNVTVN